MPTIAAIATPPGSGGIAIIRVSGPDAAKILKAAFRPSSKNFSGFRPWTLHRGLFTDASGQELDDGLAVFMPGPNTFTGEDTAELNCHGGALVAQAVLGRILELGARMAEKGEFTKRAFLNGRMDLTRAEAVADLISARSTVDMRQSLDRLAGHLAERLTRLRQGIDDLRALALVGLDFPDDEIPALDPEDFLARLETIAEDISAMLKQEARSRVFRDGCRIILAGPVNVGKSSLFNALAGKKRSLVSENPGTTRDYIEEYLDLDGLPVCLVDTAGLRHEGETADEVELGGIERSLELARDADLIWLVIDSSKPDKVDEYLKLLKESSGETPILLVWNKADLCTPPCLPGREQCAVSARTGRKLEEMLETSRRMLVENMREEDCHASPNARQAEALRRAFAELASLREELLLGSSYDLCVNRLDAASVILDEILGLACHEELLDQIFSRFCIGK